MNLRDLIRRKRTIENSAPPAEVSEKPDIVPDAVPDLGLPSDDVLMKEGAEPVSQKNVDNETCNEDTQNMETNGKETAV